MSVLPQYKAITKLSLKAIFVYSCEYMTESMSNSFVHRGLITYAATDPKEALLKIKEHDIDIVVIDVIHFHPRCIMDFLSFKKDLWIAAINCNFKDNRYYQAKEFGASMVTSPMIFIQVMPMFLKLLSVHVKYN